ncbi:hypothetical protein D9758_012523 [Tetrapyrgos nigripes]|uniref:Retrotransposon gag domain-containing protein n=1 Tax=Tetrapyrgos nigripes TaxID=182062 RepID=A0A8H5G367_9AGAR|nr:hypothetical protein D9758_012523 [Tetrapyrgos nigripes]
MDIVGSDNDKHTHTFDGEQVEIMTDIFDICCPHFWEFAANGIGAIPWCICALFLFYSSVEYTGYSDEMISRKFWVPNIPPGRSEGQDWMQRYLSTMLSPPTAAEDYGRACDYMDLEFAQLFGKVFECRSNIRDSSYSWYNPPSGAGLLPGGPLGPEQWSHINAQHCKEYGPDPSFTGHEVETHCLIYIPIAGSKLDELMHLEFFVIVLTRAYTSEIDVILWKDLLQCMQDANQRHIEVDMEVKALKEITKDLFYLTIVALIICTYVHSKLMYKCNAIIYASTVHFEDNITKIMWALSYFQTGCAATYHQSLTNHGYLYDSSCFDTWREFETEFIKEFMPEDERTQASLTLEGVSYFQGTASVDEYVDNFCALITLAGLNVEPVLYSMNPTAPTIKA